MRFIVFISILCITNLSGIVLDEHSYLNKDLPCGEPDLILSIYTNNEGGIVYVSYGVEIEPDLLEDFIEGMKLRNGKKADFVYAIRHTYNYDAIFDLYKMLSSYGDGEVYLIGDTVEKCIKLSSP
jgi:hypothetical protein